MSRPVQEKTWRVIDIIHWAEDYFDNPRREIEWFLRELLACSRMDIYLRFEEALSKTQLSTLRKWVNRRIENEPLQYITGSTAFYGRKYFVTDQVLIPRPETERLIEIALEKMSAKQSWEGTDIGTGSGCIGITMALECPDSKFLGLDISKKSLEIAQKNANLHQVENIHFEEKDILKNGFEKPVDLIVCNPPYIPIEEMETLMPDVKNHEPFLALTDNEDGLTFYRRLSKMADQWIKPNGWLIMEVGLGNHPKKAMDIFRSSGFKQVELIKDYNGDDRILLVNIT